MELLMLSQELMASPRSSLALARKIPSADWTDISGQPDKRVLWTIAGVTSPVRTRIGRERQTPKPRQRIGDTSVNSELIGLSQAWTAREQQVSCRKKLG